ncbi:tail fiber assembly protein [Morganella morganii]
MQAYYSPGKNGFVLEMQKAAFLENNDDDLIKVGDAVYQEFTAGKAGMIMTPDPGKKQPMKWVPIPPPTKDQLIEQAETQKQYLIAEVNAETQLLQTKLALGRIKDNEKALLNAWLDYLDELEAVDVSTAPDIIWPVKPEV